MRAQRKSKKFLQKITFMTKGKYNNETTASINEWATKISRNEMKNREMK